MSEKTIKKRILLAQLHALEQEAFMKREIGNMYARKNKMLDVQNCSNCQPNFCESHVRTFTGQDVMTNMPQYQPSTVTLPRQNQSPQMSPEKSLQASPQMSPVRSSPFRTPKSPIIGLQQTIGSNEPLVEHDFSVSSNQLSGHISASENEVEKPSNYLHKKLNHFTSFLTILLLEPTDESNNRPKIRVKNSLGLDYEGSDEDNDDMLII